MRQTRHARQVLLRAAGAVLLPEFGPAFGIHFVETDPPAGSGGAPPKTDPPAPKKIELTEDELNTRIEAAKQSERDAATKAKKTADDAAAAEEARKKGEFEKVANTEKEKRETAERENASLRIDIAIRDHLADEKLRDYAGCAKYIKPQIDVAKASDPSKLAEAITAAVEQYVKDNPRSLAGKPPVPPGRSGGAPGNKQQQTNEQATAAERDAKYLNRFQPPARFRGTN